MLIIRGNNNDILRIIFGFTCGFMLCVINTAILAGITISLPFYWTINNRNTRIWCLDTMRLTEKSYFLSRYRTLRLLRRSVYNSSAAVARLYRGSWPTHNCNPRCIGFHPRQNKYLLSLLSALLTARCFVRLTKVAWARARRRYRASDIINKSSFELELK